MPELPEVETIRRGLDRLIIKKKITNINIYCEKSFQGNIKEAVGATIMDLRRFGKALILDLNNQKSLMIHLRMTGQLIFDGESRYAAGHPSENFVADLPNRQTRVSIHFKDGTLFFNDQRKFGFIKVIPTEEVTKDSFIQKLAKEPWDMPEQEFYEKLQSHPNSCIKATILDQSVICGLGNIYADESLFSAKIHPERRSGTITREESDNLLKSARTVMQRSIDSGGSTMATYIKPDGTKGDYLEKFAQVFRHEGKPCSRCGHEIVKTKVAGRGTHFCPNCQKNPINQSVVKNSERKRKNA